jgi:hypothetical protein
MAMFFAGTGFGRVWRGWFGVEPAGWDGIVHPLEREMANNDPLWEEIANRYSLTEPNLRKLASPWHTDLDLGRPIEVMTDMKSSRERGFSVFQPTEQSFLDLFAQLRQDRLIPLSCFAHKPSFGPPTSSNKFGNRAS